MPGLTPAFLLAAAVGLDASASIPRASSPAIEQPVLALTSAFEPVEPSDFSLFEGDEIFRSLSKRRIADDRFTYTWHYDGKLATAVVKDCWAIENGESQGPDCAAGYTRPAAAGHKLVFSYDALSRLLTRTHLGEIPSGGGENDRPFIETREYLFDGNTLLAEVAKAKDGAIRWRKTYVPGADLHDHVQVRVETYDAAQNLLSDRLYAYIRDEQGTVLALADEASDLKNPSIPIRYLYTPYGNAHAETGPELRKGSYGFGITSVKDASGATKTQTATGTLPGGVRLSFGIDVDLSTAAAGILFERRATDGTWGALTAAEMAIGRAPDAANSDVDILPLGGFAFATSYRVRTTAGLKDVLGRTLADPKVLELPQTPPVIAPGDIGASSYEYVRTFAVEYDSLEAAANDANGLFPGGQPMGFQGQYTDPLLGFLITPNRVYDARNAVWLSEDPMGDKDSPNLYGFVGARPHEKTDPLGLVASVSQSGVIVGIRPDGTRYRIDPWADPVEALRILESDSDIHTAAAQEDLLKRARIRVPYSSAARSGETLISSGDSSRSFTHLPRTGHWIEATLKATTGLPPQTREDEIMTGVVRGAAALAPAIAGPIARAKGGVGQAIQPAALPEELPWNQRPPLGERLTYLYEKVGPNGGHLKYGITYYPNIRYDDSELGGGRLRIIASGTRAEMLKLERDLHSTLPIGPEERQKQYIPMQEIRGLKPPPY